MIAGWQGEEVVREATKRLKENRVTQVIEELLAHIGRSGDD